MANHLNINCVVRFPQTEEEIRDGKPQKNMMGIIRYYAVESSPSPQGMLMNTKIVVRCNQRINITIGELNIIHENGDLIKFPIEWVQEL